MSSLATFLSPAKIVILSLFFVIILLSTTLITKAPTSKAQQDNLPVTTPQVEDVANKPEYNIENYSLVPTPGFVEDRIDFAHPIDNRAPQLTGLFTNNPRPNITGTYRIEGVDTTAHQETYAEIPVVGLETKPGSSIQLPAAGYDIGQGYQAIVLYADDNTITLKYTAEDDIVMGYTLYLTNIDVSPEILQAYQEAVALGREQLPALSAFTILGAANSAELLVAIRDTGAFMDPRWQEWWETVYDPTQPLELQLMELNKLLNGSISSSSFKCSVDGDIPSPAEFRTHPCENCRLKVPKPANSCADTATISKTTESIRCGDLEDCEGQKIYRETWITNFTIDTKKSLVPFIGYKETKKQGEFNRSVNPNQYINDYFDGTSLYDGDQYGGTIQEERNLIWEAGVFRKLAPPEIQDKLRIELIEKGYDYTVEQTGMTMQQWKGHFPPVRKDYYSEEEFLADYVEWRETQWGQYWHYLPMFTREDAPGKAVLTIQKDPGRLDPGPQGRNRGQEVAEVPLSVPHVARMYGVTKALNDLLVPEIESGEVVPRPIPPPTALKGRCNSIWGEGIPSSLGCIPIEAASFIAWLLSISIPLGSGIAFIILAIGALILITSQGDPKKTQRGKQFIVAAVAGIITIISAVSIMRWIFRDALQIPGFSYSSISPQLMCSAKLPSLGKEKLTETQSGLSKRTQLVQKSNNQQAKKIIPEGKSQNSLFNQFASTTKTLFAQAGLTDTAEPQLLAQAGGSPGGSQTSTCAEMNIIQSVDASGNLHFSATENLANGCYFSDTSLTTTYRVGNTIVNTCSSGLMAIWTNNDPNDKIVQLCDPGITSSELKGKSLEVNVKIGGPNGADGVARVMGGSGEQCGGSGGSQGASCKCTITANASGALTTNCQQGDPPPPPRPVCGNNNSPVGQCSETGIRDPNPDLDPVCCTNKVVARVENYVTSVPADTAVDLCRDSADPEYRSSYSAKQSRSIEVDTEIAYLDEAWELAASEDRGFFQIFNPTRMLKFPDDNAESGISYSAMTVEATKLKSGNTVTPGKASQATPSEGQMYFNKLGGLFKSKKCVSEVILTPPDLQDPNAQWCEKAEQQPSGTRTSRESGFNP